MKKSFLNPIKDFLNFAWNDDSFWSWIVFIGLAFFIIKVIIFPSLIFVTGSSLPLAIVESCSMHHGDKFEDWWELKQSWYENNEISKQEFENFPLKNGFTKGDIFLITGVEKEEIEIGDVIIFNADGRPIIHRVVSLNPLQTRGDNNNGQLNVEQNIDGGQLIGKATRLKVPFLGWVKLIFYEPLRPEYERGFCEQR
jgi:signal peptidase I